MAIIAFPGLKPNARAWTPGQPPMSALASMAGYEVRVRHGNTAVGQQLALSFSNLLDVEGRQITDHYALAQGSFEVFDLPPEVFAGMASYGHVKPADSKWRYASPPNVEYQAPGIQSVSVNLVAVPV